MGVSFRETVPLLRFCFYLAIYSELHSVVMTSKRECPVKSELVEKNANRKDSLLTSPGCIEKLFITALPKNHRRQRYFKYIYRVLLDSELIALFQIL